jgi:hypothetical protein
MTNVKLSKTYPMELELVRGQEAQFDKTEETWEPFVKPSPKSSSVGYMGSSLRI